MSGQDGLRDEIAAALAEQRLGLEWDEIEDYERDEYRADADAVLDKVQARLDAAREQVAEQIAQAIEAVPKQKGRGPSTTLGLWEAADIARQHAKGDGDE